MINFYPGPSKVHEEYKHVVNEILTSNLASFNHRSVEFESMYSYSINKLKDKLEIPEGNEIVFLSSATECWETICQSLDPKNSLFIISGSFSEKWYTQGVNNFKNCQSVFLSEDDSLENCLPKDNFELICYVHNETSNGYQLRKKDQKLLREKYPEALIAVDATSSLGGVEIRYEFSDILFSSVQKCLGMAPGLAIAIISPQMIHEIESLKKTHHYNHLKNIWDNAKKNQTTHTPNTLGIISMGRLFDKLPSISVTALETKEKANKVALFLQENRNYELFLKEEEFQSDTVFCIKNKNMSVIELLDKAKEEGLILGKGYGSLKKEWFRIANFPAHSMKEINELLNFLSQCK